MRVAPIEPSVIDGSTKQLRTLMVCSENVVGELLLLYGLLTKSLVPAPTRSNCFTYGKISLLYELILRVHPKRKRPNAGFAFTIAVARRNIAVLYDASKLPAAVLTACNVIGPNCPSIVTAKTP